MTKIEANFYLKRRKVNKIKLYKKFEPFENGLTYYPCDLAGCVLLYNETKT